MLMLQALVTALLSGVFSGGVLFALNERKERAAQHLTKIEAGIEAFGIWTEFLTNWPKQHFDIFLNDRAAGRSNLSAKRDEAEAYQRKAEYMIEVYLPEVKPALQPIYQAISAFLPVSLELHKASILGDSFPGTREASIGEAQLRFVEVRHAAMTELYAAARRISLSPHLVRLPTLLKRQ